RGPPSRSVVFVILLASVVAVAGYASIFRRSVGGAVGVASPSCPAAVASAPWGFACFLLSRSFILRLSASSLLTLRLYGLPITSPGWGSAGAFGSKTGGSEASACSFGSAPFSARKRQTAHTTNVDRAGSSARALPPSRAPSSAERMRAQQRGNGAT